MAFRLLLSSSLVLQQEILVKEGADKSVEPARSPNRRGNTCSFFERAYIIRRSGLIFYLVGLFKSARLAVYLDVQ